jgi:hypothetical protein
MNTFRTIDAKIGLVLKLNTAIIWSLAILLASCANSTQKQEPIEKPCPNPELWMNFKSGMSKNLFDKTKEENINNKELDENGDYIFQAYSIKVPLKISSEFSKDDKLNKLRLDFKIDKDDDYGKINTIIKAYVKKYGEPSNFNELKQDYRKGLENHEFGEDILTEDIIVRAKKEIIWTTPCLIVKVWSRESFRPAKDETEGLSLSETIEVLKKKKNNKNALTIPRSIPISLLSIVYQSKLDYDNDLRIKAIKKASKDSLEKQRILKVQDDI